MMSKIEEAYTLIEDVICDLSLCASEHNFKLEGFTEKEKEFAVKFMEIISEFCCEESLVHCDHCLEEAAVDYSRIKRMANLIKNK